MLFYGSLHIFRISKSLVARFYFNITTIAHVKYNVANIPFPCSVCKLFEVSFFRDLKIVVLWEMAVL